MARSPLVALLVAAALAGCAGGSPAHGGHEADRAGGTDAAGQKNGENPTKIGASASPSAPRHPPLPTSFKAKGRVWLHDADEPMLVLYHHDDDVGKSREDYYRLIEGRHYRFYTSVKLAERHVNYMIFHKQEASPRTCLIAPLDGPTVDLRPARESVYRGEATLLSNGKNVTCDHWSMEYYGRPAEYCIGSDGKPLVVESQFFRVEVLDFSVGPQAPALFEAERASSVPCGVIGGSAADEEDGAGGRHDHNKAQRPF